MLENERYLEAWKKGKRNDQVYLEFAELVPEWCARHSAGGGRSDCREIGLA